MDEPGWIKIHRSILNWEWWDDANTFKLFMYLLLTVNTEDKKWHGTQIKRGQIITSIPKLSEITKLSRQSIRTSLNHLKSTGELTDQSTNRFRLITLVNYNKYQSRQSELTGKSTGQLTVKQQASNRLLTPTKEYKNNKNNKKYNNGHVEFESFWTLYPRKIKKQKALETYIKITDKHEDIMKGLNAYLREWKRKGTEMQYIPHPVTWLNQQRWNDELDSESKTIAPTQFKTDLPPNWEPQKKTDRNPKALEEGRKKFELLKKTKLSVKSL